MSNPQDRNRDLENTPPEPNHLDHHDSESRTLADNTLKDKVVKGGLYLALRQLVTVGLSVLSILVIAKQLGPTNYGIMVNALGIF